MGCIITKNYSFAGFGVERGAIWEIQRRQSVSRIVKILKGASSHDFPTLFWQRGYGALSVSERNLPIAIQYIEQQKVHHRKQTAIPRLEFSPDDAEQQPGVHEEQAEYWANANVDF